MGHNEQDERGIPEPLHQRIKEHELTGTEGRYITGYYENLRMAQRAFARKNKELLDRLERLDRDERGILNAVASAAATGQLTKRFKREIKSEFEQVRGKLGIRPGKKENFLEGLLTATVLGDIDLVPFIDMRVIDRFSQIDLDSKEGVAMRESVNFFGRNSINPQIMAKNLGITKGVLESRLDSANVKLGVEDRVELGLYVFFYLMAAGDYPYGRQSSQEGFSS